MGSLLTHIQSGHFFIGILMLEAAMSVTSEDVVSFVLNSGHVSGEVPLIWI